MASVTKDDRTMIDHGRYLEMVVILGLLLRYLLYVRAMLVYSIKH